ncbi:uncharacterized protein [Lolium perenne]|uniref:uncharacterized protein n=1 Tax=Lolium perenne TaxID=4522 RepID=UPI003A9A05E1
MIEMLPQAPDAGPHASGLPQPGQTQRHCSALPQEVGLQHRGGGGGAGGSVRWLSPPAAHKPGDDDDDEDVDDLSPSEGEWDDLGAQDAARKDDAPLGAQPPAPAPAPAPQAPSDAAGGSSAPCQDAPGEGALVRSPTGLDSLDQYGSNLPRKGAWPVSLATLERRATPVLMEVDVPADSAPLVSSVLLETDSDSEGSPSKNMDSEADADDDDEQLEDVDDSERVPLDRPVAGGVPRRRRTRTVAAGPARKSARLRGPAAAATVLQRAQERTASKNLEGNPKPPSSLPTLAQFSALPALSDAHLEVVAHDSGLAFTLESGTTTETLSLIRAKEEAQAALAHAAFCRDRALAEAAEVPPAGPLVVGPATAQSSEGEESGQYLGGIPSRTETVAGSLMRASIWNLRGFGAPGRKSQIRELLTREQLDFAGFQETIKAQFTTADLLGIDPRGRFAWCDVPARGRSGGMLLGVNEDSFEVLGWTKGTFFIRADVRQLDNNVKWAFFVVYGPADHRRTQEFLGELTLAVEACDLPLVVGGDFNLIRGAEDKNNCHIDWPRVHRFNDCIANLALREVRRGGARYTWTNKQLNPVRCVLDRVFISPDWEILFPLCSLVAETIIGSDHAPLILSSGEDLKKRSPRFFFEQAWLERPDFVELVSDKWRSLEGAVGAPLDPIDAWQQISAGIRQFLRGWGANLGKEGRDLKDSLLAQIQRLDALADTSGLDDEGWALRYHLEGELTHLARTQEEYWRQRSRLNWLLKGDANTAFFHAMANGRRRKCTISRLVSEGGVISDPHALQDHIYTFYRNLIGAVGETRVFSLANTLWDQPGRVSEEENDGLMLSFTGEELDKVLASMRVETAPGPDGWPVIFFKKFWALTKPHILAILNGFALGRVDIARLNFGVLSLIPKVQGADDIRQFRPIALINVIFKFVAKAYAIRVSPIAHRIISRAQSAFIKGRHILEGIVSLQEIIHETKSRKLRGVFLKLDFEKAFDRVNWQFLREVLHRKGFDPGWVHRAMSLVSGGQTAITVNGEVGNYFRNGRGVRQGDPLSPLLFDFAVEALAAILQAASRAGHIAGLVPHLVEGGITHLQYADDTIIMLQPDALGLANLKFLLLCFENMSGLRINFHKSEVMVLGSTDLEQEAIANLLNCKKGSFPFTYLGLPISDRAIKASDWGPLTTRVGRRADPWMGKFMSSAARLTLINACLSNLPLHAMGVYLLGEGVHAAFRKHRARFFWEANGPRRKYHWVRWEALCKPKSLGGLGIIDTRLMNICLMTKWIWKLYAGEQGLWAEILRNKYLRSRDLLVDSHHSGSQFWNAIQKIKSVFRLGARHKVRSGSSTLFWSDWWQGSGPLCSRFPALFSIAADPQITVSRCFGTLGGIPTFRQSLGPPARIELALLLSETAGTQLSDGPDIISWALEPSGKFSVKSLYRRLCQGTPRKHFSDIWKIAVPMKIRIFIWQLLRNRLPSNDNIRRRRGPSSGRCALCSEVEDTAHIFFLCPLARFMWSAVRELLGCSWNPTCFAELYRLLDGLVWKPVARRQDREALELAIGRLRSLHANFRDRPA